MTEIEDVDRLPYAVFGLYRHHQEPKVVMATDHAHASRQFHDAVPGLEGTVLLVKSMIELTDGPDS